MKFFIYNSFPISDGISPFKLFIDKFKETNPMYVISFGISPVKLLHER